jgi:hypothetical protein
LFYIWGMKRALFVFFFLSWMCGWGQVTFQHMYRQLNAGKGVKQTSDGGYIISGDYLLKTDSAGNMVWVKKYSCLSTFEQSVQQTTDGGYAVFGHTTCFGAGGQDFFLIKTDSTGDTLWTRTYGSAADEEGRAMLQTADGGYIMMGSEYIASFSSGHVYVVKTDGSGNVTWEYKYETISTEIAYSIIETFGGGYAIGGAYQDSAIGKGYILKIDSAGNLQWSKYFGGSLDGYGFSVEQTSDSGYVIAGNSSSSSPCECDAYLIKLDGSGNQVWSQTFSTSDADVATMVKQTSDGGFIVAGNKTTTSGFSNIFLIKTNGTGYAQWSKLYGQSVHTSAGSVALTSDGGFVISGYRSGPPYGAYLIKTDSLGISGCSESGGGYSTNSIWSVIATPVINVTPVNNAVNGSTTAVTTGGVDTILCLNFPTGLHEIDVSQLSIYPNPTFSNSQLTFDYPSTSAKKEIIIHSIHGKEIARYVLPQWSTTQTVKLPEMAAGVYLARLVEENASAMVKFVVE